MNVKKVVHSLLGKELIKEKRDIYGELPEPTDFLLGDNLGEKNRELMKGHQKLHVILNAIQREEPHDVGGFKRDDTLQVQGCWSFPSIQRS